MKKIKNFLGNIFFTRRLYLLLVLVALVFIISYSFNFLFNIGLLLLGFVLLCLLLDVFIIFLKATPVNVVRNLHNRFSNGDENKVTITLKNNYPFNLHANVLDELPDQFQQRENKLSARLGGNEEKKLIYYLRPVERGEYNFYNVNVMLRTALSLVERRVVIQANTTVAVMPSFLQMRKYELLAHDTNLAEAGSRKMRKLGHSIEFEQIKEYVTGDDIRSINWKATARKGGQLMINNYTDERSQQIYCIIDKSRAMKMPFDGMTLLDHSINTALVLSQVALIKHDKAGLITFDENLGSVLPADRKALQMNRILETLYNQQTRFLEADHEKLHLLVRTRITQRSLLVLFTNFESLTSLQRQLPYIRSIARNHLLLVVFFENTGLKEITNAVADNVEQVYIKTIAEKFAYEKRQIVKELHRYGILSILTPPKNVTVNTVNKYLELKTRQMI
jgi:uncharacterized protein (DUF58 family)